MPIIETETWVKHPEKPGVLVFGSQRPAQDVFNELEAHLKAEGRLPDEYFLLSIGWQDGAPFPKDAEIFCEVNYGGSEGVYLDVSVKYSKDVYERSQETGEHGWINRPVVERFATGKTLGDRIEDLDKMNLVAASVTAAFYGGKREIEERYAKIESGELQPVYLSAEQRSAEVRKALEAENAITSRTIYGGARRGDWVIAAGNNDYEYLIGTVKEIVKTGTPEHAEETTNDTDAVHVDFTAFDYPPERIAEIEEQFSGLYGEPKAIDDIALDDVIMAPDMLIRITDLGHDEIGRMGNLRANCESFCACFVHPQRGHAKIDELMARVDMNLEDYHSHLEGFGQRELISMAGRITAMSDAHSYLSAYYHFEDDDLDFFLQFANPLEIVADEWHEHRIDLDDMSFTLDNIMSRRDLLADQYELVSESEKPLPAEIKAAPEKPEPAAPKQKQSLAEKLQAASEKAKAQGAPAGSKKTHNNEER